MAVTIVVGGQFGSEGKGKVCAFLAERDDPAIMVRCGGPNSGHTVYVDGEGVVLRQLPVGAVVSECRLLIPAGGYVRTDLLKKEMTDHGIDKSRVGIDPNAVIVREHHAKDESYAKLGERIGSTLSGTGAAVAARVGRGADVLRARDSDDLSDFLTDVAQEVAEAKRSREDVIVEGTQGFGLSLYHTPYYPYATSRDTTAAGFASEVGISPRDIDRIVMVIRAFPIRVGGNSGPLGDEITWDNVTKSAGAPRRIEEYTSVTERLRRVAEFDPEIVRRAILINKPSEIVLNHLDHVDWAVRGMDLAAHLTPQVLDFIATVANGINHSVSFVGTGPHSDEMIFIDKYRGKTSLSKNLQPKEVANARTS